MFWKKKKLYAIEFKYIVDGVDKDSKLLINDRKTSDNLINDIIKNNKSYAKDASEYINLQITPEVEVVKFNNPKRNTETHVDIIAQVNYRFTEIEEVVDFNTGFGTKIIGLVALMTIIGSIFFFISYRDTRRKVEAHERKGVECFIQFIGEKPYSIVVGSSEYPLNSNGTMSLQTRTFLNPWDQQVINSGKCKRVDLVAPEKKKLSNSNTGIVFTER